MAASLSLLLMHDAVELMMIAVLDELDVQSKDKREFIDFWPDLKAKTGNSPPDKGKMQQLNKARVQLKHNGLLPDPKDVQDFMPRVEGFFENVLQKFCSVDYTALSLVDALENEEVRRLISDATGKFDSGGKYAAMLDLAVAYERLQRPGGGKRLPLIEPPPKPRLSRNIASHDNQRVLDKLYDYFYACTARINANGRSGSHGMEPLPPLHAESSTRTERGAYCECRESCRIRIDIEARVRRLHCLFDRLRYAGQSALHRVAEKRRRETEALEPQVFTTALSRLSTFVHGYIQQQKPCHVL